MKNKRTIPIKDIRKAISVLNKTKCEAVMFYDKNSDKVIYIVKSDEKDKNVNT